jgi:hypothetical protein
MGLVYLLSTLLTNINLLKNEYHMPWYIILFFTVLLPMEYKANIYILSIEFKKMKPSQMEVWQKFAKTWFFGILLLMLVIWRTYFKMEFLIMPICYKIYDFLGFDYQLLTWIRKIPVFLMGGIVVCGECILVARTLIPKEIKPNLVIEWICRIVILLSVTFFTTGLVNIFGKEFTSLNADNILIHLPFASIIFTFFYIPLRWVELISDVIDCENIWQLWLFWISTFVGMLLMFI